MAGRTWFVTGSSRGLGREWTEAALERGDRVAAAARDLTSLTPLVSKYGEAVLPVSLDVTDRLTAFAAVQQAADHFGTLDIVLNNAGYGLFGMVEEVTEAQAREQLDTNFFGALWVTQAALPIMRAQGHGHLIQVSSVGGLFSVPGLGLYHASKFALEGFTASLAKEVKDFGIRVTLIEPGGYDTEWSGSSAVRADPLPAYDGFRAKMPDRAAAGRGNPVATREAILKVADADEPPLRIFFGKGPLDLMRQEYAGRIAEWEAWAAVSHAAHGPTSESGFRDR
ncbi:MAG TPA: SDR family oxidoreductase [Amycolatopsis sp.]|uniref:SDR family oxidoreductase n=1 Tax=Amycolatopsis sp. TaxID=37632 RepID=UPI002B4A44CD|nr:SDR family oxidoreductase [Amycolatopsis sp.]HKS45014.1 SDR family oxidoreductase [Amycolatopsis sp.]